MIQLNATTYSIPGLGDRLTAAGDKEDIWQSNT
jgi:hypothetical protein